MFVSAGHVALAPVQDSAGSHEAFVLARHTTLVGLTPSAGQSGAAPVHDSATSHVPAEGLHTTPPITNDAAQLALDPVQRMVVSHAPIAV